MNVKMLLSALVISFLALAYSVSLNMECRRANKLVDLAGQFSACHGSTCLVEQQARNSEENNRQHALKAAEEGGLMKDGKPHGPVKIFYPSGELKEEGQFEYGELHGEYLTYYENGGIQSELNYYHGQAKGIGKIYYENGQLKSERIWGHGIRAYDETGKLTAWDY